MRGAGLFDFESEKYSVEGDCNNKLPEKLRSEIVGIVCEAAARAMNQGVSLQQAIAGMAKPTGYDLSRDLLPELAELGMDRGCRSQGLLWISESRKVHTYRCGSR